MSKIVRLICREDDATMAANVGGAVHTTFRTFEMVLPDSAAGWLTEPDAKSWQYVERRIIGLELAQAARIEEGA